MLYARRVNAKYTSPTTSVSCKCKRPTHNGEGSVDAEDKPLADAR